jgi:putative flippase GtrA
VAPLFPVAACQSLSVPRPTIRRWTSSHVTRFGIVGFAVTAVFFAIFRSLLIVLSPTRANLTAFVIATQLNFVMSYKWTWVERTSGRPHGAYSVLRRALLFNGTAAIALAANSGAFITSQRALNMTPMGSAALATIASAGASFLLNSRVTFARTPSMARNSHLTRRDISTALSCTCPHKPSLQDR